VLEPPNYDLNLVDRRTAVSLEKARKYRKPLFERDCVFKVWSASVLNVGIPPKDTRPLDARASNGYATMTHEELVMFCRDLKALGAETNREEIGREAERHFGGRIRVKALSAARIEAGARGKVGRPRKSGE
jgi:hypothetical protein